MELGLKGKVALVTGTGSQIGMGKAIVLTLAKEGCDIVSSDIDIEGSRKTADEVKALGRKAIALKANVANSREVSDMVKSALSEFGKIDILVNTAGGTAAAGPLHQAQEEKWEKDIAVNFLGSMHCAKAVLPGMMERKYGKIVNFSSAVALNGMPGSSSYAGAKAGVIAFTKCLALEVGPLGINVNCLAPTMVMTNFGTHATMDAKRREEMAARTTLRRLTTTQDIANTVVFLVSDISSAITGQVISI
ncbi:MAG: SDR family NAD(P)-dependent oxidoreductase [Dehalococcoidales bacterium]